MLAQVGCNDVLGGRVANAMVLQYLRKSDPVEKLSLGGRNVPARYAQVRQRRCGDDVSVSSSVATMVLHEGEGERFQAHKLSKEIAVNLCSDSFRSSSIRNGVSTMAEDFRSHKVIERAPQLQVRAALVCEMSDSGIDHRCRSGPRVRADVRSTAQEERL